MHNDLSVYTLVPFELDSARNIFELTCRIFFQISSDLENAINAIMPPTRASNEWPTPNP